MKITQQQYDSLPPRTVSGRNMRSVADIAKAQASVTPSPSLRYVIGIDPGVQTGFAVWDRQARRFVEIDSTDFWGVFERMQKISASEVKIIVEIASTAPLFWQRKESAQNDHTLARKARNVGQVTREASLLVEGLRRLGYRVVEVKPQGKKNQEEFKRITGWPKRTNQHERDSAMLAYQG